MLATHYYPFELVKDLILKVFPEYTGRKDVIVEVVEPLHTFRLNTTWCGGSRNEYAIVSRENFEVGQVRNDLGNHFARLAEGEFVLTNGFLLFEKGFFEGKPKAVKVYVTSDDIKLLPPSSSNQVPLTNNQALALHAFSAYKAGYAGQTRRQQANSACFQNPNPFKEEEWAKVVGELQGLGYLRGKPV